MSHIIPTQGKSDYKFAFLVHPRSFKDIERKYPFFKYIPDIFIDFITNHLRPVVISKIQGTKSSVTGAKIDGYVISVFNTAHQMTENRSLALKRITQACHLARKKGASIIGLGGLTSSFSKGGLDLIGKVDINITTGHAYTSYNILQNILAITEVMEHDKKTIWLGVVGATGSIGSTTAKLVARNGYLKILLIDLDRKNHHFAELMSEIRSYNSQIVIETSHQVSSVIKCDIIVAATNAPEALITAADLKPGATVIDDAQPSDVHPDVLDREDVLVIEAGVTHTPGISSNFNFGLKDKYDNFCCLAEVILLASQEHDKNYVINKATIEHVDDVMAFGKKMNFKIADFQNIREKISKEKIEFVKSVAQHNAI